MTGALRRAIGSVCLVAFAVLAGSLLTFAALDASPSLRRAVGADRIRLWSHLEHYAPHPVLAVVPRGPYFFDRLTANGDQYADDLGVEAPAIEMTAEWDEFGFRNSGATGPVDVVVVGDSFVESGESNDDTLAARIARRTGLSTYTLGRAWYGPFQYVALLREHAPRLRPRWALYCHYDSNDARDAGEYLRWKEGKPYHHQHPSELGWLARFARVAREVRRLARKRLRAALERVGADADEIHPKLARIDLGGDVVTLRFAGYPAARETASLLESTEWRALGSQLRSFREVSEAHGIEPIAVFIPSKFQIYADRVRDDSGERERRRKAKLLPYVDASRAAFLELAAAAAIPVVDLTPDFRARAAAGELLYYRFDTHWNSAGRRAAAARIAKALRD